MSEIGEPTSDVQQIPMVIDTDGGIDDAVALFHAVTDPGVDLLAVTVVHGNVPVDIAAASVCRVLDAAGCRDVPVVIGEAKPIGPVADMRPADFIHGTDGLGNTHRPPASFGPVDGTVAEVLGDVVDRRPGEVVLVTIGPLSNIARLVGETPDIATRFRRLVAMGGAVTVPGNALPVAEANIADDPVAAQQVVTADWSQPPLLVGLDVTHRATMTATEIALLDEQRTDAAAFLAEPLAFYRQAGGTFCEPGEFPCHDLLAVMAATRPLVSGPVLPMAVHAEPGPAWGATVADRRVPFFERAGAGATQSGLPGFSPWEIGLDVDVDAFRAAVRALFGE